MSVAWDLFLVDGQPNRNILKILNIYLQCHKVEDVFFVCFTIYTELHKCKWLCKSVRQQQQKRAPQTHKPEVTVLFVLFYN